MRRGMGRVPRMTAPPLAYPDITMTNKYANSGDEKGKKLDVPQRRVGIGDRGLCCCHGTGSGRFQCPSLALPDPPRHSACVCAISQEAFSHASL